MQNEEFINAVGRRAGLPRDEAEALTHATLRVLAERISGGEAEDLKAQMPKELQPDLIPPQEEAQRFGADEFARRVARRTGISEADAGAGVIAVLATIRDAVDPGEFDDVLAQLGREFAELVDAAT
ncbi:DUF2267 domain-containing protein [Pseudonocardia sp. CA-142604]|uniref:DUF2267 domain-containing protein n=1 Tax=Pseudonocardia sp. CA-142604 TaxID=3240024 RepID=UPI003D8FCE75